MRNLGALVQKRWPHLSAAVLLNPEFTTRTYTTCPQSGSKQSLAQSLRASTALSRELSYLLRHGAEREGLPIRVDGYVSVDSLLKHRAFRGTTLQELMHIVETDGKARYSLVLEDGLWWVRANQGHSMPVESPRVADRVGVVLDLKRITSAAEVPMAVHGTTLAAWRQISSEGISRMTRQHIHLAQGLTGTVISGMRSSSEIVIFIDVERALDAGIAFFVSSNGVLLSPGNEAGYIAPRLFSDVRRAKSNGAVPRWPRP
ncbi:unnamed protein product [Mycena citricolor]|uniref:2'-phosphotransferase n=1 Tax=Mycena citricolor TaxID=2018698 RepID=A0AAD2H1B0_9AGAR|nr:unnamed protein product [Mycena citricolor]